VNLKSKMKLNKYVRESDVNEIHKHLYTWNPWKFKCT